MTKKDVIYCPMCNSANVSITKEGRQCNVCGFSTEVIERFVRAEEIRKEIHDILTPLIEANK